MRKYALPSREQCLEILKDCCVPEHIVRHCIATANLGVFLAEKLKEKGETVDVELVERACLLHDVLRICDVHDYSTIKWPATDEHKARWRQFKDRYKGLCHEDAACRLLEEKYPELAQVVRKHRYPGVLDERDKPKTWEEKIVYYADKRVMHDKIVPLKERLEEAHRRSATQRGSPPKADIEKVDALIYDLEREIFERIGLDPAGLTDESINSWLRIRQRNTSRPAWLPRGQE